MDSSCGTHIGVKTCITMLGIVFEACVVMQTDTGSIRTHSANGSPLMVIAFSILMRRCPMIVSTIIARSKKICYVIYYNSGSGSRQRP